MSRPQLTICCNAGWNEAALQLLQSEIGHHRLLMNNSACAAADVAFGQPDSREIINSQTLRWVHLSSAGYTRYDNDEVRDALQKRKIVFTNSSHVYDEPCAQHVLAMMLGLARQLPQCHQSQRTDRAWETGPRRAASFLLNEEQTVVLLSFGAIAQRLVQLLRPFELKIIAVRRSVEAAEDVEIVSEGEMERVLGLADHVVNVLPENASTIGLMNATRFGQMKCGAMFYNIGRGKTVDSEALHKVLCDGHLGAAYLDVTEPEPLPVDHPLWSAPNCFITPHSGGGHHDEQERLVRHFARNLRAFELGESLLDRVLQS